MAIRSAAMDDAEQVAHIVHKTIEEIYPAYYPSGAVHFFMQYHSPQHIEEDIAEKRVFVLEESNNIIGTVTVKSNSINRLFVLPEYQGKDHGRELMDYAERAVFEQFDLARVDASFPAKSMYLKRGYVEAEYHCVKTDSGQFLCYDVMQKTKKWSIQAQYDALIEQYGEEFPWWMVDDDTSLLEEFRREASNQHPLFGKVSSAVLRCASSDDVLFLLKTEPCAIVHLTYSSQNQEGYPRYTEFPDLQSALNHIKRQFEIEFL